MPCLRWWFLGVVCVHLHVCTLIGSNPGPHTPQAGALLLNHMPKPRRWFLVSTAKYLFHWHPNDWSDNFKENHSLLLSGLRNNHITISAAALLEELLCRHPHLSLQTLPWFNSLAKIMSDYRAQILKTGGSPSISALQVCRELFFTLSGILNQI